jgi:pyruvate dehydrogenase E2 component (dihydrolipoamide acetyltransferase)
VLVKEGDSIEEGGAVCVVETAAEAAPEAADAGHQDAAAIVAEPGPAAAAPVVPSAADEPAPTAEPQAASELTVEIPDIGTDEAVELIELCVAPGDTVAEGDSLVVLESDKASMEVPSPAAGEVLRFVAAEGAEVKQGDPIVVVKTVGETTQSTAPVAQQDAPAAAVPSADVPDAPATPATPAKPAISPEARDAASTMVYAGPAVRKLARELGVDLAKVTATGPRARLLKEDLHGYVQNALKSGGAVAATAGAGIPPIPEVDFAKFGKVDVVEMTKMEKVTAANMQRSWLNVPHVTQFDDADISALEAFRGSMKPEAEKRGVKLTPLPFLLKACAAALKANPRVNCSLGPDDTLVYKQYVHIGMAVDTPAGLVVPVIRDVDKKGLFELAEEVVEMAGKARDRKLMPTDMQGACFTISSLGGIGGTGFTPIVNAPEVAILGVSRAEMKPVWNGKDFEPRKMLPLSLSYDHRVVNGGDAGRFMTFLSAALADIRRLLL